MFGLDDLALAGLIASIAGGGMQYMQQQSNANRVSSINADLIRRQQELSDQAARAAMDRAEAVLPEQRAENQAAVEAELLQNFSQPVAQNLEAAQDRVATQGNVSNDYRTAKAASDANQQAKAATLAGLFSKQIGANRLRQNEGYLNADAARNVATLQNFAQGDARIGQMKMQDAANRSGVLGTLGGLASTLGAIAMTAGDFSKLFADPGASSIAGNGLMSGADYVPTIAESGAVNFGSNAGWKLPTSYSKGWSFPKIGLFP